MKLSHSKLSKLMSCPMSYKLSYELGIYPKAEKPALSIGSAVHWGIEHNTDNLSDYFIEQGTFKQGENFTREQLLSESMVYAYLEHKDEIFDKILTDPDEPTKKLSLISEEHELFVTAQLKSKLSNTKYHEFIGIIDLLLLTEKGFIIIDYKTSTYEPDWDSYLDQIYRYIFMLQSEFPEVPILKIGIINIKKSAIRQKKSENESQFLNRLQFEYKMNIDDYVNYHEYAKSEIDEKLLNSYIENLSVMADTAQTIVDNKLFFINYSNAKTNYGKGDYYDIFYNTPDAYMLYTIKDFIWDDDEKMFIDKRDCIELDMKCIKLDGDKVLNKYERFESLHIDYFKCFPDKKINDFIKHLHKHYYVDDKLLDLYLLTFNTASKFLENNLPIKINEKYD